MVSFSYEEMKNQTNHHPENHLHSLHKSSVSRITKKPPTLAAPTTGPKVYKVKPIHFRELVQKLTGVQVKSQHQPQLETRAQVQTQTQTRRTNLQSVAPPPLPLLPHQIRLKNETQFSIVGEKVAKVEHSDEQKSWTDIMDKGIGSTELTLSPNFQSWFSSALLSPGPATVSQFEQKPVT